MMVKSKDVRKLIYDYYKDEVKLKHCNKCGQALDWSEDEKI